jgi:TonB family protein
MRAAESMTLLSWVIEYLVNSLWMIPLIFCVAWLTARLMRACGEVAEHRVWVGALLLQVALPACRLHPAELGELLRRLLTWHSASAMQGNASVNVSIGAGTVGAALALPETLAIALAVAYCAITLYCALRLLWSIAKTHELTRSIDAAGVPASLEGLWLRCRRVFGVDAARMAISPAVNGPVTLGVRRGLLLLPEQMASQCEARDLEAALAHECAHIRRRDFLKNLLYRALLLPLSYHPIAWMTLARIAVTREMVCDAEAARFVAGRESYARSLLRLAAAVANARPDPTLHAIGIFDANTFERRVMRLRAGSVEVGRVLRTVAVVACVGVGLATCASALAFRTGVAASGATADHEEQKSVRVSAGVMAGNVISQKTPVYPAEAKANNISGAVVLKAVITKEGIVARLEVVSGPEELRASALDAVKEWRYKPYILNGDPRAVETTITVNYHLEK